MLVCLGNQILHLRALRLLHKKVDLFARYTTALLTHRAEIGLGTIPGNSSIPLSFGPLSRIQPGWSYLLQILKITSQTAEAASMPENKEK
ncbi:hypothetical protein F0726_01650 [Acidithiobacillus caldus]|jgi:hypothetical protein|nr:hypothetical protein F0726_01650 [Acidithiobacillus caldus]